MKQPIYYTVLTRRNFFLVKYAEGSAYKIFTFPGTFSCPGEASQEFKITVPGRNPEYLPEKAFERKVRALASEYQQDLAKLADWKSGKAVRI